MILYQRSVTNVVHVDTSLMTFQFPLLKCLKLVVLILIALESGSQLFIEKGLPWMADVHAN